MLNEMQCADDAMSARRDYQLLFYIDEEREREKRAAAVEYHRGLNERITPPSESYRSLARARILVPVSSRSFSPIFSSSISFLCQPIVGYATRRDAFPVPAETNTPRRVAEDGRLFNCVTRPGGN